MCAFIVLSGTGHIRVWRIDPTIPAPTFGPEELPLRPHPMVLLIVSPPSSQWSEQAVNQESPSAHFKRAALTAEWPHRPVCERNSVPSVFVGLEFFGSRSHKEIHT